MTCFDDLFSHAHKIPLKLRRIYKSPITLHIHFSVSVYTLLCLQDRTIHIFQVAPRLGTCKRMGNGIFQVGLPLKPSIQISFSMVELYYYSNSHSCKEVMTNVS